MTSKQNVTVNPQEPTNPPVPPFSRGARGDLPTNPPTSSPVPPSSTEERPSPVPPFSRGARGDLPTNSPTPSPVPPFSAEERHPPVPPLSRGARGDLPTNSPTPSPVAPSSTEERHPPVPPLSRGVRGDHSNFHLPYNPQLVPIAKQLRKNPTPAEKKLWQDFLRTFPHRVLRQRPIDNFIVDFYCAALGLVIEVDGDSHFTEEGKAYDAERTSVLEGYGLRVVRFTNVEVFREFEGVCWRLEGLVGELRG